MVVYIHIASNVKLLEVSRVLYYMYIMYYIRYIHTNMYY